MRTEPRFAPALFFMIGGFVVWALHFLFIYGFAGFVCERPGWARLDFGGVNLVHLGVGIATLAAMAALAALCIRAGLFDGSGKEQQPLTDPAFPRHLALGAVGLGGVAILWEGIFSILTVPACY